MKVEVKSPDDAKKIGVLETTSGRLRPGHLLKVYNERPHDGGIILYYSGHPGGYAGQAVLKNGNFRKGDRLIVEAVHPEQ